ncbi:MAG: hypothetical protein NTW87_29805 [Planctomycetota bacterium]|nr:hypothetical protein [Planctomycetota bacterium]
MRKTLSLVTGIVLALAAMWCPAAEEKKDAAADAKKEAAPEAKKDAPKPAGAEGNYEMIEPQALKFRMQGQADYGNDRDDDGIKPNAGKVGTFTCEGTKLELANEQFVDGFIVTKDYGKVKIRFTTTMIGTVLSVYLTPEQKARLLMLRK